MDMIADRKAILRRRALALAREPESLGSAAETLDVVEFRMASESYAIESWYVREVLPLKGLAPLPSVPSFILGIVNIRGRIVSVVELGSLLSLPERDMVGSEKVIVLGDDRMEFGILADAVSGTRAILWAGIQPPLPTFKEAGSDYVKGIAEACVIVLDAKRILGDDKLVICQTMD
jgi:purine-binding chemotaxis protein CheW